MRKRKFEKMTDVVKKLWSSNRKPRKKSPEKTEMEADANGNTVDHGLDEVDVENKAFMKLTNSLRKIYGNKKIGANNSKTTTFYFFNLFHFRQFCFVFI